MRCDLKHLAASGGSITERTIAQRWCNANQHVDPPLLLMILAVREPPIIFFAK